MARKSTKSVTAPVMDDEEAEILAAQQAALSKPAGQTGSRTENRLFNRDQFAQARAAIKAAYPGAKLNKTQVVAAGTGSDGQSVLMAYYDLPAEAGKPAANIKVYRSAKKPFGTATFVNCDPVELPL